jgi:hypothetical protein
MVRIPASNSGEPMNDDLIAYVLVALAGISASCDVFHVIRWIGGF